MYLTEQQLKDNFKNFPTHLWIHPKFDGIEFVEKKIIIECLGLEKNCFLICVNKYPLVKRVQVFYKIFQDEKCSK